MSSNRSLVIHTVPERGMKTEEFAMAQAAASRVFGRDKEAGVVFQGDRAYVTNDGTIVYPALNDGELMTKQEVLVARGFADHETAHKRYTDIPITAEFNEHCKNSDNQLLQQVANAIDDLRVDGLAIRDYSGAITNIEAGTDAVMNEFLDYAKENPDDVNNMDVVLPLMITAEGRKRMGFKSEAIDASLDMLNAENRKRINSLVDIALQCKNPHKEDGTREVIKTAKMVIAAKEEAEKDDPEDAPKPKSDSSGVGNHETVSGADLMGSLTDEVMQHTFERHTTNDTKKYKPYTTQWDTYNRVDDPKPSRRTHRSGRMRGNTDISYYEALVHGMHGKISTMSRKLERALMSMQRRDWTTNAEQGSLDPKRLVQASLGKPNVMRYKSDRKELDTAVSILIDLSGSMAGGRAQLAQKVSIALALVFEKVGVAYEVLGFNNTFSSPEGPREAMSKAMNDPSKYGCFSRFEELNMFEFKGFQKRLIQERGGMSCISAMAGGNNSDVDAVKVSHMHLKARTETRKIMLVASDGYPACRCTFGDRHQHQHLRNRVEMVEADGITCVGIGICSDAVSQFYPKFVVVNDIEDLPKASFDQIAQLLIGERFKVDNADLITPTKRR